MVRLVMIGSHHGLVEPSRLPAAAEARTHLEARLGELKQAGMIRGGIAITSCHRTEVVVELTKERPVDGKHQDLRIALLDGLLDSDIEIAEHTGRRAVEHLLRTAVGLESVVIGEEQILGQFGEAFRSADDQGLLTRALHKLRTRLLVAARDTRAKLGLTGRKISSMAAVGARNLAERAGRRLAVVGAGETGRLALEQLARRDDLEALYIVNRSLDRAQNLARHHGATAMGLREFLANPPAVDGVLFALSTPEQICTPALAQSWRMVVDLSLPSVVTDEARSIPSLEVVDLDGIQAIAQQEAEALSEAVTNGRTICLQLAEQILGEMRADAAGPNLGKVVDLHLESALAELDNALRGALRHLEDEDRDRLKKVLTRAAKKTANLHIQDVRRLVQERSEMEAARDSADSTSAANEFALSSRAS